MERFWKRGRIGWVKGGREDSVYEWRAVEVVRSVRFKAHREREYWGEKEDRMSRDWRWVRWYHVPLVERRSLIARIQPRKNLRSWWKFVPGMVNTVSWAFIFFERMLCLYLVHDDHKGRYATRNPQQFIAVGWSIYQAPAGATPLIKKSFSGTETHWIQFCWFLGDGWNVPSKSGN